jgi:hypothetical protein
LGAVIAKMIIEDSGGTWADAMKALFASKVAIVDYSKIPFVKEDFEQECSEFYEEIGRDTFALLAFLDIATQVRLHNMHMGQPLKILRASANASTILFDDAPASQNERCILLDRVVHGQVFGIKGSLMLYPRKSL